MHVRGRNPSKVESVCVWRLDVYSIIASGGFRPDSGSHKVHPLCLRVKSSLEPGGTSGHIQLFPTREGTLLKPMAK